MELLIKALLLTLKADDPWATVLNTRLQVYVARLFPQPRPLVKAESLYHELKAYKYKVASRS